MEFHSLSFSGCRITHRRSTGAPSPTCIDPLTIALRLSLLTVTLAIALATLAASAFGDEDAS